MPYQERWVIDELTESTATVLRARFMGPLAGAVPPEDTSIAEAERLAQIWSDEVDHVLERSLLEAYISEEAARSSGQTPRGLREGDVYLVVSPQALALDGLKRPEHTEQFVRACREGQAVVRDATAEARQFSRMAYVQALTQSPAPREAEAPET